MRRFDGSARPSGSVDPANFVLPGQFQRLIGPADGEPLRLYRVSFEEGARTYWHTHSDAQILFGISGRCVVVDRAGDELLLEPGDAVVIDAGEEHWHGAAPGGAGEHLAINLGAETTWLESSQA
ncbi:MAG: cupin domain-containing protein [Gemmatimonadota bacterium]|nr:cupin domain-containing protein [Gemmatimonadota bacterium]MDH3424056.1 cupin domain-containing protein [Gemmatimonadota bacterium]